MVFVFYMLGFYIQIECEEIKRFERNIVNSNKEIMSTTLFVINNYDKRVKVYIYKKSDILNW